MHQEYLVEPQSQPLVPATAMATNDIHEAPAVVAAAAPLTLPRFWIENPTLWFAQVEAKFALSRVTSPTTKYFHLLEALPPQVATEVQDILTTPVTATSFDALKSALLTRLVPSESACLQRFLAPEDIGDRTPSQYLRYLQRLLGTKAANIDEALVKELFLQRLPSNVRFALAGWHDFPLTKIADIADRLMSTVAPSINATSSRLMDVGARDDLLLRLSADVAEMKRQLASCALSVDRSPTPSVRPREFRRSLDHLNSPPFMSHQANFGGWCYYHRRFGSQARKCAEPCTWQAGNHAARR